MWRWDASGRGLSRSGCCRSEKWLEAWDIGSRECRKLSCAQISRGAPDVELGMAPSHPDSGGEQAAGRMGPGDGRPGLEVQV